MPSPIPEPPRIARLRKDKHHRPVPWFAHMEPDGTPDFRVTKPGAVGMALAVGVCWICGTLFDLQEPLHWVIGPMCVVNRNTGEPPCHAECARYAAQACPFLTRPQMTRRDSNLPEDTHTAEGFLARNPGVTAIYITRHDDYQPYRVGRDILIRLGPPLKVRWWAEGRQARRAEVVKALDTGVPALADIAQREDDPDAAMADLTAKYEYALRLVPS